MESRQVRNQPLNQVNTDKTATTTVAAKTTARTNQNKTSPPPHTRWGRTKKPRPFPVKLQSLIHQLSQFPGT